MARYAAADKLETTPKDLIRHASTSDGSLEIVHRWFAFPHPARLFAAFTVTFAVICYWFFDTIASAAFIWAVLTYALAAVCFNSTRLVAKSQTIRWTSPPIPFRRPGRFAVADIDAILYGRILRSSGPNKSRSVGYGPRYGVSIRTKTGKLRNIFSDIRVPIEAEKAADAIRNRTGLRVEASEIGDPAEFFEPTYRLILLAVLVGVAAFVYVLATVPP